MRLFGKTALVLGLAGAMALGSMTASEARGRGAAIAAGAAGFAAGAAIGSAANGGYYGNPGYDSYAYAPGYVAPQYYGPTEGYYDNYNTNYSYDTNGNGPWRERQLEGHDY
jgi:hypothetical protein